MRIIKILLLPLLAYGGVMGYLWYEVRSGADDLAKSAAAFAKVSYDSVYVSPLGNSVGLDGIVIEPLMTQDQFRIKEVRFNVPHVGYFITASSMQKGQMPDNLGIDIRRIRLDINSQLFSMLDQMQQQAATAQAGNPQVFLSGLDAAGCGNIDSFTLGDARRMGIGEIVADLSANMGYNEETNITHISINAVADQLYTISMRAEMESSPQSFNAGTPTGGIRNADFSYSDTGYHKLRNAYCAGLNGSDEAAYVDTHIRELSSRLGATFPQDIIAAYRKYMLKGGKITAKVTPSENMPTSGLQYYQPAEVIDMLGLDAAINGKRLDTSLIQWGEPTEALAAKPPATSSSVVAEPEALKKEAAPGPAIKRPKPRVTASRPAAPTYRIIDVADAKAHINQMVEVTKFDGKVRKGMLERVNEGRIYLVIQVHGGELSYPVKLSDIRQLKALF